MLIFRLEHIDSGIGPFQHTSKLIPTSKIIKLDYISVPDIDSIPEVRNLLMNEDDIVFGWVSLEKAERMIKDYDLFHKCGFTINTYETEPLFISECGQVIFRKLIK